MARGRGRSKKAAALAGPPARPPKAVDRLCGAGPRRSHLNDRRSVGRSGPDGESADLTTPSLAATPTAPLHQQDAGRRRPTGRGDPRSMAPPDRRQRCRSGAAHARRPDVGGSSWPLARRPRGQGR